MSYNIVRFENDLSTYYKHQFPFKPFLKWLQYGKKPTEYFCRREFAFILANDVHLRYKSFTDPLNFQKALCTTNPHKLDLGAVYNYMPSDNKKHNDFQAMERELVIDIDLTDYDTVRNCCKDAKVCPKCWKFIVIAVRILDDALLEMFDFKARMWVFSGRRGVHCWIGDKTARELSNTVRAAIATKLNLFKKNNRCEVTEFKNKMTTVPPPVWAAYRNALKDGLFEQMVIEQGWLDNPAAILEYPYLSDVAKEQLEALKELETAELRWKFLLRMFDRETREMLSEKNEVVPAEAFGRDRYTLLYFVLQKCYPRLDVNVTTGTNHLLKSPFCVHPKTGNVAVPLDVDDIQNFDVESCPRIDHIVDEMKAIEEKLKSESPENDENTPENRKYLAYKHGKLAPYVKNFEKFVELAIVS